MGAAAVLGTPGERPHAFPTPRASRGAPSRGPTCHGVGNDRDEQALVPHLDAHVGVLHADDHPLHLPGKEPLCSAPRRRHRAWTQPGSPHRDPGHLVTWTQPGSPQPDRGTPCTAWGQPGTPQCPKAPCAQPRDSLAQYNLTEAPSSRASVRCWSCRHSSSGHPWSGESRFWGVSSAEAVAAPQPGVGQQSTQLQGAARA